MELEELMNKFKGNQVLALDSGLWHFWESEDAFLILVEPSDFSQNPDETFTQFIERIVKEQTK